MRYLIILLISVPLQFILLRYQKPLQNFIADLFEYERKRISSFIKNWMETPTEQSNTNDQYDDYEDSVGENVRTNRPPGLKFRIGQVAVNTRLAYIGIIIGWHVRKDKEPEYELLTDHPKIPDYKTKAVQSELVILQHIQIYHPEASKYFEMFDHHKSQYIPQPWLRIVYPTD